MKIVRRNRLRRGGFAGLRETRLVMSPRIFRDSREAGTSPGLGRFVYLADARFMPKGETRMHAHREIDVISMMVEGRIRHEGSLQDGQELTEGTVQVQRAGGEGFTHNEINPDDAKNRMIQLWVLPDTPGEPSAYQLFESKPGERVRVYGGTDENAATFSSKTIIEIAQLKAGDKFRQPARSLVYVTTGKGKDAEHTFKEGDLIDSDDFNFIADRDSSLLVIFQE